MRTSFANALLAADNIRIKNDLDMFEPANVFDICAKMNLTVRFVDINMEGMYISQDSGKHPTILLSHLRPLPRRNFTCAHELGHHVFNHGTKVDGLMEQTGEASSNDEQEILVNNFAAALLMPVAGVKAAFIDRNVSAANASALQFYTISSLFGTGYQTLVTHCKANNLINEQKEKELLRHTPIKILKSILGADAKNSHFKLFDGITEVSAIDIEVSNYIILPRGCKVEGINLKKVKDTQFGIVYLAVRAGIARVVGTSISFSGFVRIQNTRYVGLAEYRHLESTEKETL